MLRKLAFIFVFVLAFQFLASAQTTRHFTFHYAFTVKDVPAGQRVRVWFPAAHSDEYQHVRVLSSTGDLTLKKTRESRFGNEIYFAEASKQKVAIFISKSFTMSSDMNISRSACFIRDYRM